MNKTLKSDLPKLFVHCALIEDHHVPIMEEIFEMIDKSGMKEEIDLIICTVGKATTEQKWYEEELNNTDISTGEFHTLGILKEYAEKINKKIPVGYVHTKGIINGRQNPCISDWRKYMGYFVIEKMKNCIESVSFLFDVAGVDWKNCPNFHFSGNFWWSNTDYIKSLPKINPPRFNVKNCPSHRHLSEFWIGYNNPKVKCFHQSNINIFERHLHRYEECNYKTTS